MSQDTFLPKASVIVTTFNRAKILAGRSLPSALNQAHPNFEVIVVDDWSTDDTESVVRRLQEQYPHLRYVKHDVNKGLAASRNTGIRQAKGKYVVCLDDDDALDPKFLEITVPVLDALPAQFGAVGCGRIVVYPSCKAYHLPSTEALYTSIDDGFLLRKEVFSQIIYDEKLTADEDADFGIQFSRYYKLKIIDQPLLLKYTHPVDASPSDPSVSISYPSEKRFIAMQRFIDKNLPFFYEQGNKKELAHVYRMAGRTYCWGGRMREGRPLLRQACLVRPTPRNLLHFIASLFGPLVYRNYWALETRIVRFIQSRFTHRLPSHL